MFKIDNETMTIYLTRGNSATIIFSAKDEEGNDFHPTTGDKLIFSAAVKVGMEPVLRIENVMASSEENFWAIKFRPEDTQDLKISKYAFDVDIEIYESDVMVDRDTIIGKTDTVSPTLVLWGDV